MTAPIPTTSTFTTTTPFESEKLEATQLVIDAQSGDRDAFGELFRRFERHVFAIALRRLGDYAEAQELTQDVFIQALTKLDQLRTPEAFGGWLRSITNRMAINRLVRRVPDKATETEALEASWTDDVTPLDEVIERENAGSIRRGLSRLGTLDRETLEAFYVKGQSLIEMSDDFAAPVGTIKRRLHVARKRLAKQVEELVAV
jgi:RNA polymerase sigma-70 factor (ECF subfamily)